MSSEDQIKKSDLKSEEKREDPRTFVSYQAPFFKEDLGIRLSYFEYEDSPKRKRSK